MERELPVRNRGPQLPRSAVNSIRSELLGESSSDDEACLGGQPPLASGQPPAGTQMVGDRMVGRFSAVIRETQWGQNGVHGLCPKNRPLGVRASVVAVKRVTTVEPRDAGRWMHEV